jgi:hypothetical protein
MAPNELVTVKAPRTEVALTPNDDKLHEAWLVLHLPGDQRPVTVLLDGGPFDRDAAVEFSRLEKHHSLGGRARYD